MKKVLMTICVLVGFIMTIKAQEPGDPYSPMLQDGKKWVTDFMMWDGTGYVSERTVVHYIDGDTLIGGKTWKKAYTDFINYGDTTEQHFYYFAAIREEGEKVFCVNDGEEEELLLYDFGLKVGDKVRSVSRRRSGTGYLYYITGFYESSGRIVTVENIDTIQVKGRDFRRFTLKSDYRLKAQSDSTTFKYPYFVWVEGIGCEGGLFVAGRKTAPQDQLYCMKDDTVIFEYDDFHVQGVQERYYPEGTFWEEERYSELLGKKRSAYLLNTVCGDTIINETVYSKVTMDLRESDGHDALSDEPWWDRESPWHWLRIGTYFIRQDGDKVYYYGRGGWIAPVYDEPKERLALDFSWEKGKQLPGAIVVDSIYSITLADGNEYECVKKEGECVLIRGIGLVGKWFTLMGEQMHPNWDGSNPDYGFVLNFTRNGVKIYEWDRDAYLGIKENISEMKDEGLSIYTIQGIRIPAEDLSSLKPGIYIRGGHKYVVK